MLYIQHPSSCLQEREYIFQVILGEFLGLAYTIQVSPTDHVVISMNNKTLEVTDHFFQVAKDAWLQTISLPEQPLKIWDSTTAELEIKLTSPQLPVLYGIPGLSKDKEAYKLSIDIFGSAFFMLSRYEEAVIPDRDNHDRFPATASLGYKSDFLDRPIVDEYVEVLWATMTELWPTLKRRKRTPRTLVSCDVDLPYVCARPLHRTIGRLGGDLLKRHSLTQAFHTLSNSFRRRSDDYSQDPYLNAINWMMDVNEKVGNRIAFYFIAGHSHPSLDGCYHMDEPVIRNLIRRIAKRGHEVGLHGSYNTYLDGAQLHHEADRLRHVLKEEKIHQNKLGGRQHFLRWEISSTAIHWNDAGMDYDSTLSYADRPGFRCGTCHEFPMFNIISRCPLKLYQRPLILMECSVIDDRYMGLGYSKQSLALMQKYKRTCYQFSGDFTLLWHNSHLTTPQDRQFYLELIKHLN